MALQRSCLFSLAMHMPQRTLRPLSTVRTSFRHGSGYRYTSQQRIRTRSLHTTPSNAYARKGSQDKDSIDRESTEYSKSGTDDGTAEQDQAAFDPSITDPTGEKKKAGQGKGGEANPLEVSPANPEVSKPRGDTEGGAEHAAGEDRSRTSGGGSGQKAGRR